MNRTPNELGCTIARFPAIDTRKVGTMSAQVPVGQWSAAEHAASNTRPVRVAACQLEPLDIDAPRERFADELRDIVREHRPDFVVFPELHCFGTGDLELDAANARLRAGAVALADAIDEFGALARELGVWLCPGSIVERAAGWTPQRPDAIFNTALLLAPNGACAAVYRKVFPWRPTEPYLPGDQFVVADTTGFAGGIGHIGMSICYDSWWPESTRHLAWMGAEIVCNVVKTTTPDREQECILARANAIANQLAIVSVNVAGPTGEGRSIIVGPEGEVLTEAPDARPANLIADIDRSSVWRVREQGTCGSVFPWQHFRPDDAPIPMPLYGGAITPSCWRPQQWQAGF